MCFLSIPPFAPCLLPTACTAPNRGNDDEPGPNAAPVFRWLEAQAAELCISEADVGP